MRKLKLIVLAPILLSGLMTTSGCVQSPARQMPVKPSLTTVTEVDGQMCMSLRDATSLGLYILGLERGYN
ncbi:putative O-spanin [Pseudomonas phage MR4]|uniref:Putative O-spanin n=1 Tax=Pseudomonas phage MR4 TaxID=2711171 RepID=A0A6M3TAD1_9CAUD|nr:putative O-spanin [Pseudomonas phage MR4]